MSRSSIGDKFSTIPSFEPGSPYAPNYDAARGMPALTPEQQSLLLAALESNKRAKSLAKRSESTQSASHRPDGLVNTHNSSSGSTNTLLSRHDSTSTASGPITFGDGLFPNFMHSNTTFDVDFPSAKDESPTGFLNPALIHSTSGRFTDGGEKRKSPDDDDDEEEDEDADNGGRRDSDEKIAKKPGRKLITTEPTTKRKAQNRAAQRAFRDRKEKHVKDLELKVTDLEKVSDSASQENSILRAEIQRLQTELRDYKKRLSTGGNLLGTSPTIGSLSSLNSQTSTSGHLPDFQFDFSRFGNSAIDDTSTLMSSFPANSNLYNSGLIASLSGDFSGNNLAQTSASQSHPNLQALQSESGNPRSVGTVDSTTTFKPVKDLTTISKPSENSRQHSQSSLSHSGSASSAGSPKSSNQNGASSSSTSPGEPILNYDLDNAKTFEDIIFDQNALDQDLPTEVMPNPSLYDFPNLDWLSQQNGGQFNPQLFGDYRESQAAVVGDEAFTSGFFEDPYNMQDYSATTNALHFNIMNIPSPSKFDNVAPSQIHFSNSPPTADPIKGKAGSSLMDQVNRCQLGETGQEPGAVMTAEKKEIMTTHRLWAELQTCPKFLSGDLDIDTLCSELSAKATCAESGMTIPKEVVEKVLWKLVGASDE